jgi:hypothetical protein
MGEHVLEEAPAGRVVEQDAQAAQGQPVRVGQRRAIAEVAATWNE